ncbi:MAG TPA: phosphate butyryltransferase [Clostridiaceae bacterium]|nr:phosphate butyryltransferase [Clostridiaceae bacterium]
MSPLDQLWQNKLPQARVPLIAVGPYSAVTLTALSDLAAEGLIRPVLLGDRVKIRHALSALSHAESLLSGQIIDSERPMEDAAVLISHYPDSALMKGDIHSDVFLRGIVAAKLVKPGRLMSHLAVFETNEKRPLFITDPSIFINPDVAQRIKITANAIDTLQRLGYDEIRVAVLSSVETASESIPSSMEARAIAAHFANLERIFVDGPLSLDLAVSAEAARTKASRSEVAGRADVLVVPNLDAGNMLCKGLNFLAAMPSANLIAGTVCPVVFSSRAAGREERKQTIRLALSGRRDTLRA